EDRDAARVTGDEVARAGLSASDPVVRPAHHVDAVGVGHGTGAGRVGANGIALDAVTATRQKDPVTVPGDEVARAGLGPAHVGSHVSIADTDAMGRRRGAAAVGADPVSLDAVVVTDDVHSRAAIARDEIPGPLGSSADEVAVRLRKLNAIRLIPHGARP